MTPTPYIWQDGKFVNWDDAKIHFLTHSLHYGTAVFEGVRAYPTAKGSAIFRGLDHFERLLRSANYYFYNVTYTAPELLEVCKTLLSKNNLSGAYIRPLVYYGYEKMGLSPVGLPTRVGMAAWEWGTYLGEEGYEKGIRVKCSSWARIDSRILPPQAKCAANYANSTLAKMEALSAGYDEALLLNINGNVAEGSVVNFFMVKDKTVYTPSVDENALEGITRNSVMVIAKDLGYNVVEKAIQKEEIFSADELFFTGTAAEITPIRSVDDRPIGNEKRGPVTKAIQEVYHKAVRGELSQYSAWLDYIS
jgi:branched-chain amino acid aminotransferase